jgi:anti-sigma factor RsiW
MSDSRRTPERLIDGLLGPAGPELTCEQCFEMLDVYVDHELAGDSADARIPGMREHLQGCPACAEEHASLRDLMATIEGEQTR